MTVQPMIQRMLGLALLLLIGLLGLPQATVAQRAQTTPTTTLTRASGTTTATKTATKTTQPTGRQQGRVRYNATLRAGPGGTFAIVGRVQKGAAVTIRANSEDGVWYQLVNGEWIAAVMVQVSAPRLLVGTPMATVLTTTVSLTTTSPLSTAQAIASSLLDATAYTVTFNAALTNSLSVTDTNPTLLATPLANVTPKSVRPRLTPTPNTNATALRNANLRAGPGTNYAVVGGVRGDDPLLINGSTGDTSWYRLRDGSWIAAFLVEVDNTLSPLPTVAPTVIAAIPTAVPTPTATPKPTSPPAPTTAATVEPPAESATDPASTATSVPAPATSGETRFILVERRLWNPWENGGTMDGPSVHCGQGRALVVNVLDEFGGRLNGVAVQVQYGAKEIEVTGSQGRGDGRVDFVLGSGQDVRVVRDSDGTPANSDTATGLVTDPRYIDFDTLRGAGYCQDDDHCRAFANNVSCIGHYSWTVTFQRQR